MVKKKRGENASKTIRKRKCGASARRDCLRWGGKQHVGMLFCPSTRGANRGEGSWKLAQVLKLLTRCKSHCAFLPGPICGSQASVANQVSLSQWVVRDPRSTTHVKGVAGVPGSLTEHTDQATKASSQLGHTINFQLLLKEEKRRSSSSISPDRAATQSLYTPYPSRRRYRFFP